MELLILVVGLGVLGYLAIRFGYDSRELPRSEEHTLANHGMVWEVHMARLHDLRREAAAERIARLTPRPTGRARRTLALGLRVLAYRLSPELAVSRPD
jgi:hypothetical protein